LRTGILFLIGAGAFGGVFFISGYVILKAEKQPGRKFTIYHKKLSPLLMRFGNHFHEWTQAVYLNRFAEKSPC
jgi:hypothetical protein